MKNLSQLHKKYIAAAALLLLAAFMGLACFVWGGQIIGFVSDGEKFRRWVNSGGRWAKAGFVLMMAFQIVLAFIPGEPLAYCTQCKEWLPAKWLPKDERGKRAEQWFECEPCGCRELTLRYLSSCAATL